MINFADAINGWLDQNQPGLYYFENHRIFDRGHHHVICIFFDGDTCLESEKIVPAYDPKFFEQLGELITRHDKSR